MLIVYCHICCEEGDLVLHVQAKNGFHSLTGIDYCSYAIELAESVACDEQLDIEYKVRTSETG